MKSLISALRVMLLATLVSVVLVLIALSEGWHTPLVNYLAKPYKVSVGHTELNWFPLSLEIADLTAGEGESALTLRRVHVRSGMSFISGQPLALYVQLEEGQLTYAQQADPEKADWQVAGLSLSQWQQLFQSKPNGDKPNEATDSSDQNTASSPSVAIHLHSLQVSDFEFLNQQQGLPDLTVNRLLVGPFFSDQPEKQTALQLDLATASGTVNLTGAVTPLSESPTATLALNLDQLSPSHQWLAQVPEALQVGISAQLTLSVQQMKKQDIPDALSANLSGKLQLRDLVWEEPSSEQPDTVTVQSASRSQSDTENKTQSDTPHYALDSLQLEQIDLNLTVADLSQVAPVAELSLGQFLVQGLTARQTGLDYQLKDFSLNQLQVKADAKAASIETGVISLDEGVMDYQQAQQAEPVPAKDTSESTSTTEPVSGDAIADAEQEKSAKSEDQKPPYRVTFRGESFRVTDQHITYRDLNLKDAPLTQLEIANVQFNQPRYPAEKPFPWSGDIWLNGQSRWQMKGNLQTAPLKVNMQIDQSGLHLPDISPYSEHYAEVVFAEGNMDNRIELEVTPNSLKGRLGFDFSNLDMTLEGSQANLNLPLQTAFSLLEDSDSRIELSIDLDKKGEDLRVGTSAIVKELLLAASQKGAVAYLKYALQPYGALLTLKDVGSNLLKSGVIHLEPVELAPLQATLTEKQKGYAQKVSGILQEKKGFKLNYCYLAAESEKTRLIKQLGDVTKADAAFKELNQKRLTQWRKLFAREGLASRMKQCTQDDLNKQRKKLKAGEAEKGRFTLFLKP